MRLRWPLLVTSALVLASLLFWSYRLLHPWVPAPVAPAAPAPVIAADLSRLLGVDAPPPVVAETVVPAEARFQLIGVVSNRRTAAGTGVPRAADEGVALIAVDGQPAKAYRVGMVVDGETVLQAVEARGARLGPRGGAAGLALNLPPLAEAARGQLAAAGVGQAAALASYTPPMPVPMATAAGRPAPPAVGVAPPDSNVAPPLNGQLPFSRQPPRP